MNNRSQEPQDTTNPFNDIAKLLACDWTPAILQLLQRGNQRYSQIEFALHEASPRELSTRLRYLITQGIIKRHVQGTPPTTNYELTTKGDALQELLQAVVKYKNAVNKSSSL